MFSQTLPPAPDASLSQHPLHRTSAQIKLLLKLGEGSPSPVRLVHGTYLLGRQAM
jgi:hypothetical protein